MYCAVQFRANGATWFCALSFCCVCLSYTNVFASVTQMYLLKLHKCICWSYTNVFAYATQMYLLKLHKCICLSYTNVFAEVPQMYLLKLHKCICLNYTNVFASATQMYLSMLHKCRCLSYTNVFAYAAQNKIVLCVSEQPRSLILFNAFLCKNRKYWKLILSLIRPDRQMKISEKKTEMIPICAVTLHVVCLTI